jgi:hypothetical protein
VESFANHGASREVHTGFIISLQSFDGRNDLNATSAGSHRKIKPRSNETNYHTAISLIGAVDKNETVGGPNLKRRKESGESHED